MMIANDLASAMKAATQGQTAAVPALTALGNAISTYIKANAVVAFSWAGALAVPPFTPDPVVVATGKITLLTITLTPSMATSQPSAIAHLSSEITAGVKAGSYNVTDAGFATAAATMSTIPDLVLAISAPDRDAAYLAMATQIVAWIIAYVPAQTCSGSHGLYVGVATPTTIS
jgi:hypothetical protein